MDGLHCAKDDADSCPYTLLLIKSAKLSNTSNCEVGSNPPVEIYALVEGVGQGSTQEFDLEMYHLKVGPSQHVEFEKIDPPPAQNERGYHDEIAWRQRTMRAQPPERREFKARVRRKSQGVAGTILRITVALHHATQPPPYCDHPDLDLDIQVIL